MVRGNIRARRDHLRGPRATFRKAFLPRPPFDLARFDLAFQKETTTTSDDTDLTNVSCFSFLFCCNSCEFFFFFLINVE